MAIVKMKRLRLLGLTVEKDAVFRCLQHLGCVEVSDQTEKLSESDWSGLVSKPERSGSTQKHDLESVTDAIILLNQYAPEKSSFLSPRKLLTEQELFHADNAKAAIAQANQLLQQGQELRERVAQLQKLQAQRLTLLPWQGLELPLSGFSTPNTQSTFGTIVSSADPVQVKEALGAASEASELFFISSDTELHYILLLSHRIQTKDALEALRHYGFSSVVFKDITDTAGAEISRLDHMIAQQEAQIKTMEESLSSCGDYRDGLLLCSDYLTQELEKLRCMERLLASEKTFLMEGWVTAPEEQQLKEALSSFTCAYELTEPEEAEYPAVPVKLKNGPLSRCMNVVTEMYSLPAYDGIDPNPLMAPFFIFFFGMMMADMAYGILMVAAALIVLKKSRPREGTRNFMELVLLCGISTFVFGALTGGFFGDFIPQLLRIIHPDSTFEMPALFTPLNDTVAILLGSLVLGVIQVITGMVISVVKKIKDGDFWSAFWDEITWWIILGGAALAIFGIGTVGGVPIVLIVGCGMLVYGAGRNARGFGKVTALIGTVYNGVTGYFSDILSYLRLMALMLSGSVIAQVFNTLGSVFGNVLIFIVISMIGNALNLALNLLGCYVHDLRLQCLEFFNRFYKDGGRAFSPLSIQTKYHDIIKEEN